MNIRNNHHPLCCCCGGGCRDGGGGVEEGDFEERGEGEEGEPKVIDQKFTKEEEKTRK